jgi:amidase
VSDWHDLTERSARELSRLLCDREASALEVLDAHLDRIARYNPLLNAIVTLDSEGARARARETDARRASGEALGPFAGLPFAVKDMEPTAGMRTTFGSPIYRDHVPAQDSLMVARLRSHGLNIFGKTNTPEFAMGSQTFNPIFGATRNPWNTALTCGGSSGGAAVGVATCMLPFADGSDLGGSLRNPGNFNSVFGLRPSAGRVPEWPSRNPWSALSVLGPIARTASDAAFLLAAMAGADTRDPLSLTDDPAAFLAPLERDFKGVRVAYSPTLGGLPVEPAVSAALDAGISALSALGCIIDEVEPDFADADLAFDVLRALYLAERYGELLPEHRELMKDTAVWNIERGLALNVTQIIAAQQARGRSFDAMRRLLIGHEFLLAPVNQVVPFGVDVPYVTQINGEAMPDYVSWQRSCTRISATGHPAASVPIGFTDAGLPVGLQVVGRHREEFSILQFAHAVEQVSPARRRRPPGLPEGEHV